MMSSPTDVILNELRCTQTVSSMLKTYTSTGPIAITFAQMSGLVSTRFPCVFTMVFTHELEVGVQPARAVGTGGFRCQFTNPPGKREEMTPAGAKEADSRMPGWNIKYEN